MKMTSAIYSIRTYLLKLAGQREEEKEEDTGKEKNGKSAEQRHVCGMPLYPDASQSWGAFRGPVEG